MLSCNGSELELDGRFQQQAMFYFISGFLLVTSIDCKLAEAFPSGQAVVPGIALAAVPEVDPVGGLAVSRPVGQ